MVNGRELALAGLFGATALLLPFVFHILHLGHIFMPMYIPLVTLAFLARPGVAGATAFIVPLLSGLLTGMPPFFPPIAPIMCVELLGMAATISFARSARPSLNVWLVLIPVLLMGRVVNAGLTYLAAGWLNLPAGFVAGLSFVAGWPGVLLMIAVIPPFLKLVNRNSVFHGTFD